MENTTLAIEKTFLWQAFLKILKLLIFICGAVPLVIIFVSVFMRYVMHKDFFGYEDIVMLFTLWLYYLGAAYATWEESHIRGDMMSFLFKSGKAKKYYKISLNAFAVICMAFWMKWGFEYVVWNFNAGGKTSALKIPLIASELAIYFGICGLFFYSIFHLVKYIKMSPAEVLLKGGEDNDI